MTTKGHRDAGPAPDRHAIRAFYDAFTRKLVRDYVDGNLRQARAFELVRSAIGPTTRTILDVGCGIGASSASYASGRADTTVHGVDISPNNIEVARALFARPGLEFSVGDMSEPPGDRQYDLIAMVDMHEHIPREQWPTFHRVLAESLSETGTLVMTTPSPLHQEYLRTHKPEGIQVVDETLVLRDVTDLAEALRATVIRYEWVGVWHSNDYVYTVISRAPRFDAIPRRARWISSVRTPVMVNRADDLVRRAVARVDRERRRRHVRRALGAGILALLIATADTIRTAVDPGHRSVPGWGHVAPDA